MTTSGRGILICLLSAAIFTGCAADNARSGAAGGASNQRVADSPVGDLAGRAPAAEEPGAQAPGGDRRSLRRSDAPSRLEGRSQPPPTGGGSEDRAADAGEQPAPGAAAPEKAAAEAEEPALKYRQPAAPGGAVAPAERSDADESVAPGHREPPRRQPPVPERPRRPEVPPPPPSDMYYRDYGVNPWVDAAEDPQSTFAMDVDTGSYTLARRYLLEGNLPPMEAVRVEEFVNYFDQDYPWPERGAFAISVDGAPSPWGEDEETLVRVGIQGRPISEERRRDAVLTFVIDVSGSMDMDGRLELVKDALLELVDELRPGDEIGIVAYSDEAWMALPTTEVRDRRAIGRAIRELYPMSSTNAEAGLTLGYDMAESAFRRDAINRVILCSDGVANVGATGPDAILRRIRPAVEDGITLTAVGVGMGNYNDVLLEQLADNGDGSYFYVDDLQEAKRVFVEDLTGTLQVIARDAKVQVEFDPEMVNAYRLIGYENRDVADRDFENDRVDAGEIGAGHSVTALYAVLVRPGAEGRLATVRVRYEDPDEGNVREVDASLRRSDLASSFRRASARFRMSVAAATFAEILRDSYYTRQIAFQEVIDVGEDAARDLRGDPEVQELVDLMHEADRLVAYER